MLAHDFFHVCCSVSSQQAGNFAKHTWHTAVLCDHLFWASERVLGHEWDGGKVRLVGGWAAGASCLMSPSRSGIRLTAAWITPLPPPTQPLLLPQLKAIWRYRSRETTGLKIFNKPQHLIIMQQISNDYLMFCQLITFLDAKGKSKWAF